MNDFDDLLDRIESPHVDVAEDVTRGERALRRRHRWQLSGVTASVTGLVVLAILVGGTSGTSPSTTPGFADRASATARSTAQPRAHPTHHPRVGPPPARARRSKARLLHLMGSAGSQATLHTYREVLAEHLDPTGTELRLAQNEQAGGGSFGTKLDWRGGGMLEISVSTSWHTSDWNAYPPGPGQQITYRGHEARVLVDGENLWVAVEHDDGEVVMLQATPTFGNNGTSIPETGLTTQQLLEAAADPKLQLPPDLQ